MNPEQVIVEGTIQRVTYHSPQTGYGIFRLKTDGSGDARGAVTVVGTLQTAAEGLTVRATGTWTTHPKYGRQLKAEMIEELLPKTSSGVISFLGSGLIKGMGPKTAEKIVNTFGERTLEILDDRPQRLREISGFSQKKVDLIVEGWKKQRAIREVMIFLQSHAISTAYAFRIFKTYGPECVQVVQTNPYQLADEVHGIGFKLADRIAASMGISQGHPKRIRSGLLYILQEACTSGHTLMLAEELVSKATQLLEGDLLEVENVLAELKLSADVYAVTYEDQAAIALKHCYVTAQSVYVCLKEQRSLPSPSATFQKDGAKWIQKYSGKLSDEQKQSICGMATHHQSVLTGGPGCGKTTTLQAFVSMYRSMGKRVLCCAPTGKAARRMEEVIGVPAKTIHRLLEYDPQTNGFIRNRNYPLSGDVLVVDESSMIDIDLALALLQAVPKSMQLIWVGDKDQLPSVGPGRFFADVIEMQLCPVYRLTHIFRQSERSQIVVNAHKVNQGEFPWLHGKGDGKDFFFIEKRTPEEVQAAILEVVCQRIPATMSIGSHDVKVLTPMHRGEIGTIKLNQLLQARLNPASQNKSSKHFGVASGAKFFEGDLILQKVNNYTLNVMNGETGRIQSINLEDQEVRVQFEDKYVTYDFSDFQDVDLGYALSIHKSQGSEFPAVVIPVHESQFVMLHRTLLYTALTRARKLCVLIGTKRAIAIAVKRQEQSMRRSLLPLFGLTAI